MHFQCRQASLRAIHPRTWDWTIIADLVVILYSCKSFKYLRARRTLWIFITACLWFRKFLFCIQPRIWLWILIAAVQRVCQYSLARNFFQASCIFNTASFVFKYFLRWITRLRWHCIMTVALTANCQSYQFKTNGLVIEVYTAIIHSS